MADDKAFGNIFRARNKANERQPDSRGDFRFTVLFIEAMLRAPKDAEGYVTLEFAAWDKQGPKAGTYLSGDLTIKRDRSASPGYSGGGRTPEQTKEDDANIIPF